MKRRNVREIASQDAVYARNACVTSEVLLAGKWRIQILCALLNGPIRIGELGRIIPGASKKMLAQGLRKLEADGIVVRNDLSDMTLHIEYELNPALRQSVINLLNHLAQWGIEFMTSKKAPVQIHIS